MPPPSFRLYAIGAGYPKPRTGTSLSANRQGMDGPSGTGSRQRPRRGNSLARCESTDHRHSRLRLFRWNRTGPRVRHYRSPSAVSAQEYLNMRHSNRLESQLPFASPLCVILNGGVGWRQKGVKAFFHDCVTFARGLFQAGAVNYDYLASVVAD